MFALLAHGFNQGLQPGEAGEFNAVPLQYCSEPDAARQDSSTGHPYKCIQKVFPSASLTRARSPSLTLSFSLSLSGSGPPPFVYVEGWLGIGSLEVLRQPGLSARQAHD